jgi:hypothetical protein
MSTKGSGEFRRVSMLDLAVVWEADRGFKLLCIDCESGGFFVC